MSLKTIKAVLNDWLWDWHSTGLICQYVRFNIIVAEPAYKHNHRFLLSARSFDNNYAAFASFPACDVTVWNIRTGKQVRIGTCSSEISCMAFSSNNRLLAAGTTMGNITVWDIQKEKRVWWRRVSYMKITSIGFSHKGNVLAFATNAGNYYFCHGGKWEGPWRFLFDGYFIRFIMPDDDVLYLSAQRSLEVKIRNACFEESRATKCLMFQSTSTIEHVGISRNGRFLVSCTESDMDVWDAKTPKLLGRLERNGSDPDRVSSWWEKDLSDCFSPNGKYLFLIIRGRWLSLWNVETQKCFLLTRTYFISCPNFYEHSRGLFITDDTIMLFGYGMFALQLWEFP